MNQDDLTEQNEALIKKGFFDMFKSYKPLRWKTNNLQD
jgi:hypothetical protein